MHQGKTQIIIPAKEQQLWWKANIIEKIKKRETQGF